jgi:hypothetical protein
MYADKDQSDNISIMELTPEESKDLGTILFNFECPNTDMGDREKARLLILSAKIRFKIIDALKLNDD